MSVFSICRRWVRKAQPLTIFMLGRKISAAEMLVPTLGQDVGRDNDDTHFFGKRLLVAFTDVEDTNLSFVHINGYPPNIEE